MLKDSCIYPIVEGICNVLLNLFVILLASTILSPSMVYPIIGVGGLMIVTLVSIFAFKERLRWWQWLGVVIGAMATALLSI